MVRDHYETFRAAATRRDGEGLPRFIDDEFCGFLCRGQLAAGFPACTAMAAEPSIYAILLQLDRRQRRAAWPVSPKKGRA